MLARERWKTRETSDSWNGIGNKIYLGLVPLCRGKDILLLFRLDHTRRLQWSPEAKSRLAR
jgi:hypothetical protein